MSQNYLDKAHVFGAAIAGAAHNQISLFASGAVTAQAVLFRFVEGFIGDNQSIAPTETLQISEAQTESDDFLGVSDGRAEFLDGLLGHIEEEDLFRL